MTAMMCVEPTPTSDACARDAESAKRAVYDAYEFVEPEELANGKSHLLKVLAATEEHERDPEPVLTENYLANTLDPIADRAKSTSRRAATLLKTVHQRAGGGCAA
jgi:hypothetical protein